MSFLVLALYLATDEYFYFFFFEPMTNCDQRDLASIGVLHCEIGWYEMILYTVLQ